MTASDQVAEASAQYLSETTGQVVPGGYKQTEVGAIPENWYCCNLGDALTLQRGFDLPQRLRNEGNVPIISSSGESGKHNKAMVGAPGIVTGRYGTIGEIFYIQEPFWPLNTTLYVSKFIQTSAEYAYYLLQTVDFDSHSGKSGVPGVNRNDVHQEKIAIPPIPEQTAIANALFDVDALIDELEKLIAKKQAIKTATMQQLLTGRTRLPQFALREGGTQKGYMQSELGEIPEDWGICELQDAVDFLDGLRKPVKSGDRAKISGIYPYYGASGIVDYVNDYIFDDDLILLGEDGENILSRNLPLAFRVSGKLWVNNHAHVMKPKSNFDIGYLTDFLEGLDYSLLNSGTAQPKLNKQACLKIKVVKPTKDEQTAIANILFDMDAEIQTLQKRLSKTRQIKQGMMQELLTGKIRLVKPAPKESANV
ncbi:MAG: hypothetical protein BVN35_02100 [Proteobacteria bacterium ST_bin11]|nr:MAG: hypothetical protein BVN35_02100 [Proteobacteria bacterium ST_bin11]